MDGIVRNRSRGDGGVERVASESEGEDNPQACLVIKAKKELGQDFHGSHEGTHATIMILWVEK